MINMRYTSGDTIEIYNEHGSLFLHVDNIDKARELLRKESIISTVVERLKLEKTPTLFNFKDCGAEMSFMKI